MVSGKYFSYVSMVIRRWRVQPPLDWQHSFLEIDHELFSTVILSLPLIHEGQLSVSDKRMCTILVNRLDDWAVKPQHKHKLSLHENICCEYSFEVRLRGINEVAVPASGGWVWPLHFCNLNGTSIIRMSHIYYEFKYSFTEGPM